MAKSKKRKLHKVSNLKPNLYARGQVHKNSAEKTKSGNGHGQDSRGPRVRGGSGKHQGKTQGNGNGVRRRELPFNVGGNVLCVGEGDFSFALCLLSHHRCSRLLATSYDDEETCYKKYPQARANVQALLDPTTQTTPATSSSQSKEDEQQADEYLSDYSEKECDNEQDRQSHSTSPSPSPHVLFSVDAKSLSKGGSLPSTSPPTSTPGTKLIRSPPFPPRPGARNNTWDAVIFNYPHVGGLSTDVNRQVRSNQELLVSFFRAAIPLLSKSSASSPKRGKILVSLFDTEPYTLWNIRDLARHCGLKVIESMGFLWEKFPGYRHARTLGNVEGKGGAWRGEDREGRWYVFGVDEGDEMGEEDRGNRGKGKRRGDSDDDD